MRRRNAQGACPDTPPRRFRGLRGGGSVGRVGGASCAATTATAIRPRCLPRPTAARRCSRFTPSITRSRGCARAVTAADARPDPAAMVARGHRGGLCGRRRRGGTRSSQPLVAAIAAFGLSRAHFDRIIDARERDLDDDAAGDLAALVDYAEGTSSTLRLLSRWRRSGPPIRRRSRRRARSGSPMRSPGCCGRCRFTPLPDARTSRRMSRREAGLDPADYARRRDTPALRDATAELAETAAAHLAAARRSAGQTPRRGAARRCCRR